MICFEAQHLFGDPLDEMMILFKDVVQVFDLQDFDQLAIALDFQDGIDCLYASQIGSAFIDDDSFCTPLLEMVFLKKRRAAPRFRRSESMKSRVWPFADLDLEQQSALSNAYPIGSRWHGQYLHYVQP